MRVFDSEQVICCDIDDTIVLWDLNNPGEEIEIKCPYEKDTQTVIVHEPHVRLIKERLARGATIIAWSAGGWQWAQAVFQALGITGDNVHIYSKPIAYVDDSECQKWMGARVYLPPDSRWKLNTEGNENE